MDWVGIGHIILGVVFGAIPVGVAAYIALSKSLARQEVVITSVKGKVLDLKTNCSALRAGCQHNIGETMKQIKNDLDKLEVGVKEHHERGPHITEDFKQMLKNQYTEMCARLGSIEQHLRKKNGGVYP